MASVTNDPNGRKRIQFAAGDGSRKTIRLGKATVRQAEAVKVRVEQLALAATGAAGVIDDETVKWLAGLGDVMYGKLAAVGLVGQRESARLGAFLDGYISDRHDVKAGTTTVYGHTRRNLIDFFHADKPLRDITPGDADQWRLYLIGQGLADNTVRRRCGIAKQFLRVGVRRKLILSNPFEDLKSAVQGNPPLATRTSAGDHREGEPSNQETHSLTEAEKAELEKAGRRVAARELVNMHYKIEEMPTDNPGCDLRATKGLEELRVEVKAHTGRATVVDVTHRQYKEYLDQQGYHWELWNVEHLAANDAGPVVITRYSGIPDDALDARTFRVDLKKCRSPVDTSI